MKRRSLLGFLLLNIVITVAVVSGLLFAYNRFVPPPAAPVVPPMFVAVSNTPDANGSGTRVVYVVVTATPGIGSTISDSAVVSASTIPLSANNSVSTAAATTAATNTANILTSAATTASTPVSTNSVGGSCTSYTVKSGDNPGSIATRFGISLADLYQANGLKPPNPVLQIGQVLIIPGPGCDTPTPTPTNTLLPTNTVSALSTSTPATASVSQPIANQIAITQVIRAGDITEEGVSLHNTSASATVDLTGWTLSDQNGHTFTFPIYRLFPNGDVLINTRAGSSTPRVLFWGLSTPLWGTSGTTITLTDASGAVQATYPVP